MSPAIGLQSNTINVWLDHLHRDLLNSDHLKSLVEHGLISGTSITPAGLKASIAFSKTYKQAIQTLKNSHTDAEVVYNTLILDDIRQAALLFLSTYESSGGQKGFVTVTLSPYLANDTDAMVTEAQRICQVIDFPNIMITIPANRAGIPAMYQLIRQGINVNTAPLCGLYSYRNVIEAYLTALESRVQHNLPIHYLASTATFQLHVVDNKFDKMLHLELNQDTIKTTYAQMLQGQVATATARMAFQIYCKIFKDWRFKRLADKGAHPQRLVWENIDANFSYNATPSYHRSLINPETIITIANKKIEAHIDQHNDLLVNDIGSSVQPSKILRLVFQVDIDPEQIAQELETESIQSCIQNYNTCLNIINQINAC
ncbi:MAG: hypothetical protein KDJ65_13230 [Anaerolineae bacterium]|nr:hypothetical protein [Anaerolineae bacterium]